MDFKYNATFHFLRFIFVIPLSLFLMALLFNFFIQPFQLAFFVVSSVYLFLFLGTQFALEKILFPYLEKLEDLGLQGLYQDLLKTNEVFQGDKNRLLEFLSILLHQQQDRFFQKLLLPYLPLCIALWMALSWPIPYGFFCICLNWVLFCALAWPYFLEREALVLWLKEEIQRKDYSAPSGS
jgi:hypothetical protein